MSRMFLKAFIKAFCVRSSDGMLKLGEAGEASKLAGTIAPEYQLEPGRCKLVGKFPGLRERLA